MTEPTESGGRRYGTASAAAGALLVAVAWAVLQLWGLEQTPFHTKGEPREALVVVEMLRTNEWVLPRRNGVELPSKPPCFHWLGALASLAAGGASEWSIRLPSAVLSGAASLLVFVAGTLLWGARAGTIAALALMTSFEWERAATSARVDMTLTGGLTFAFVGLLLFRTTERPGWLAAAYAGMAAAVLAKGPVGLALPLGQIALLCLIDLSPRFARRLRLPAGLLAVAVVAGAWYALALQRGGTAFFAKQILFENVYRLVGDRSYGGGHAHSVGYLAGQLLAGTLPWTLCLPAVAPALWRDRATLRRTDPRVFLLVWAVLVFGFYSAAASKRGVYLLALYPALFLLLGWWWDRACRGAAPAAWLSPVLPPIGWLLAAGFCVLALAVGAEWAGCPTLTVVAESLRGEAATQVRAIAAAIMPDAGPLAALFVVAAVGAGTAATAAARARWGSVFVGLMIMIGAAVVSVQQLLLPAIARQKTRQPFAAAVRRVVHDPAAVSSYRAFDYGLVYYWGAPLAVWPPPAAAEPPFLILARDDWSALDPAQRQVYERVPMLQAGPAGNMRRLVLARRIAAPGSVPNVRWDASAARGDDEDAE